MAVFTVLAYKAKLNIIKTSQELSWNFSGTKFFTVSFKLSLSGQAACDSFFVAHQPSRRCGQAETQLLYCTPLGNELQYQMFAIVNSWYAVEVVREAAKIVIQTGRKYEG